MQSSFSISTLINRDYAIDGDPITDLFDVTVQFAATITGSHIPASWDGPEEWPDVEVEFEGAEFDPPSLPGDAAWPLTTTELLILKLWLENGAGYDKAVQHVHESDYAGYLSPCGDPDAYRDRMIEEGRL
jgi:hypothetical protein